MTARPVERQRRNDRVHAGAVRQAGVGHRADFVHAPADLRHDAVDDLHQVLVVAELHLRLFQRPFRSTYTFFGPLIMISLIVGSLSSISSGPRPNVSSSTSSIRRSRSLRLR